MKKDDSSSSYSDCTVIGKGRNATLMSWMWDILDPISPVKWPWIKMTYYAVQVYFKWYLLFLWKVDCYDITWIDSLSCWRRGTILVTLLSIDDDAFQFCQDCNCFPSTDIAHSPVFNPYHCAMYDVYWFLITLHRFGNVCFKMNLLIIPSKVRKEHVQIDETIDRRQFVRCVVFFAFIFHPWTPFLSTRRGAIKLTRQKLD